MFLNLITAIHHQQYCEDQERMTDEEAYAEMQSRINIERYLEEEDRKAAERKRRMKELKRKNGSLSSNIKNVFLKLKR